MLADIEAIRSEFPALARWTHFAIAHKAPLPRRAETAFSDFANDFVEHAGENVFSMDRIEEARSSLGALVGAAPETLAFIKNTSEGVNLVAAGLRLSPGDQVLVSELEHEANLLPWRRLEATGIELVIVSGGSEELLDRIGNKTRVVAASWVTYGAGYRFDIETLAKACRAQDALLVVDGIQGVGVLSTPLRDLGADVVTCGGHKGLLGLAGAGFLYCREPAVERIEPVYTAKFSYEHTDKWSSPMKLRTDARRFEYGNPNFLGIAVLKRSAEFLTELGLDAIEARIRLLTTRLLNHLIAAGLDIATPLEWEKRAGIVSLSWDSPSKAVRKLRERSILVSAKDESLLRIACHFYNTEEEVDRLAEELTACR